ncbi:AMP-binding protein [Arthrobacter sp. zg-Y820]|uniref:AMP-binding protein n=1 Tax=unclassified Arthrobacter TaxID=235627 RepID=UPI001E2C15A8|nr:MULTISPECIES: AMP-binding protein [unclassified Arthrobacter]MCC9196800.1 AMP-binding protein [Arthrobacter sp. zg-Y820]MDK1279662.1 AMP-binding protein [Arthrobacter sp. zg.Y820]WIB07968.1 AMP-binding protein [Arthrobacter sp. zg-Y820]
MHLSDARTIPQLLTDMARLGDHHAVVVGDTAVSYRELADRISEASRGYLTQGVQPGDRIALWAPNRLDFILAMLGAQAVGAAVVPLNTRYTGHEAALILRRSGASILVVADDFLGRRPLDHLREAAAEAAAEGETSGFPIPGLPAVRLVIRLDGTADDAGELAWKSFLAAGVTVADDAVSAAAAAVRPDDVVDILYTSGTTGLPKGVMSAHRQTLGVARAWAAGAELSPEDRYAVVNPFFHGFGYKAGVVAALLAGATIYPVETFNPSELLELIQKERISVLPGVPTIFTSLLNHPELKSYDTSSLRFAIAGAATAPETLFSDMSTVLGFQTVAQAYGMTECVVATLSRPGESLEHAKQTTGPAVAGVEIRVVDAAGKDLPIGEDGEILLRGENVMLGYFDDPEATSNAVDKDGWFHTGDIGRLDEHGCLKITDRLKDMFIVGGFNVYPAEIENVLRQHPAVNESAVIGIDDERMGSVGRAFVALLHDADPKPTSDDLAGFCKTRLANYKVPREFVIVNDFPRNGTGKVLKSKL